MAKKKQTGFKVKAQFAGIVISIRKKPIDHYTPDEVSDLAKTHPGLFLRYFEPTNEVPLPEQSEEENQPQA